MQATTATIARQRHDGSISGAGGDLNLSIRTFVAGVFAAGVFVIAQALTVVSQTPVSMGALVLAVIIVLSGRFKIKVPGRPATVSVSEVFVFASVLLFGPAAATLTLAFDGLCASLSQKNRRLHRTLFNITEPAVSIWIAGQLFFAITESPVFRAHPNSAWLVLPTMAMAAAYFALNSTLTALAVALENAESAFDIWRRHALYLAMNYSAGASLAALAVEGASGLNLAVLGLIAPLLVLSYVAYQTAFSRVEDAERHVREVDHLYLATVETLAIAVDAKDQVTHGHIRRVQRHAVAVAKALGIQDEIELKALEAASLLHDVGKLAVPDYVLNKPGALSPAEYQDMKVHASVGATILTAVEFPYPVVPIVRHHHENWDGTGYPDSLSGGDIPLGARILSVVDCFDAVTSDRPYRRKLSDEEAIGILKERRGKMYDPGVVDMFIQMVPELRCADREAEAHSHAVTSNVTDRSLARRDTEAPSVAAPSSTIALLRTNGPAVMEGIRRMRPEVEACLFARDTRNNSLVAVSATPLLQGDVAPLRLRLGQGLSGWVAVNRHTIVNSDPGLDIGDAAGRLGLRSCTSTPVFGSGDLIGVLTVYSRQPKAFSDDDSRMLGALAQEAGMSRRDEGHRGARRRKNFKSTEYPAAAPC